MKKLLWISLLAAGCASVPEFSETDPAGSVWSRCADGDGVVAVAVVKDGLPAFAGDPKAIFPVGVLSEHFVIEAALRLEERGEINLERPLTAFADFRLDPLYGRLSMRELMYMRSGLPEELLNPYNPLDWFRDARTVRFPRLNGALAVGAIEERHEALRTGRTFYGEQRHSATGFALFMHLLEKAAGKSVPEIVRDEITLPLQLRDTSFTPSAEKEPRIVGYDVRYDGLYSTVEDCVKFFAASARVRSSPLLDRRETDGFACEGRRGESGDAAVLLAYGVNSRDFLLIFSDGVSRPESSDFDSVRKALGKL